MHFKKPNRGTSHTIIKKGSFDQWLLVNLQISCIISYNKMSRLLITFQGFQQVFGYKPTYGFKEREFEKIWCF